MLNKFEEHDNDLFIQGTKMLYLKGWLFSKKRNEITLTGGLGGAGSSSVEFIACNTQLKKNVPS